MAAKRQLSSTSESVSTPGEVSEEDEELGLTDEDERLCSENEEGSGDNLEGDNNVESPGKVSKKKRKRKKKGQKPTGHRRNIKSKYDTIDDLNPEALSAQTEEIERIRRLELQQSILKGASVIPKVEKEDYTAPITRKDSTKSVVMVDLTEDDDNEGAGPEGRGKETWEDAISLGDDSEGDSPNGKKIRLETKKAGALASKYDFVAEREDDRVLVNVNHPSDEVDIFLAPQIARSIKPHQVGGVRFMFDNTVESLTRYRQSPGFGCILADAMGLGKTLQVVTFVDIFLRHTEAQKVLIVVPVNTLQNWNTEINRWLPPSGGGEGDNEVRPRGFTLFMLSETVRSLEARHDIIAQWYRVGGVLLMGYEMYRLLSLSVPSIGGNKMAVKKRKSKKNAANNPGGAVIDLEETEKEMDSLIEIQTALCTPGPDLIVCDEGHRIKNDSTNISQALKKIKTRRRIVLTGYPLQNNLLEYWCMVDFVRPKYLGTKQEFLDLFERPISNGQCIDSTSGDVRLMKYRSHVLHKLLGGFILRRGHEILHSVLPPKFEHVILVRTSHVQRVLYDLNMLQTQDQQQGPGTFATNIGPLKAFAVCSKIWNHPDIYYEQAMQQEYQSALSLLSDEGFMNTGTMTETSCKLEWPNALHGYETGNLDNSPKMMVMMAMIELSVAYGDRILVFSQSLSTLSFIEKVLCQRPLPIPYSADIQGNYKLSDTKWIKGKNYCRLDGSTNSSERDRLVNQFNSPNNYSCWAFLLSTKAGCLGINLTGANRVIVVDVSWNPCYDSQAVCRVYRYGQTKPSYIYRLVSDGSMEKRMYDRQITKQGMADRVVDELNPERHFTSSDIISLLSPLGNLPPPTDMSEHIKDYLFDSVLMQILKTYGPWLTKLPFKHESLLIDSHQDKLSEVEKYVAMKGFHQQLTVMRKGYTQQQPHPHQPRPQQPHPQQPHPQQLFRPFLQNQQSPGIQPSHNIMPQFMPHSQTPHPHFQTPHPHSQTPHPHSQTPHPQPHSIFPTATIPQLQGPSNNITGPPSGLLVPPNIFPFQQSHSVMGGVSQITPGNPIGGNIAGTSGQSLNTPICIIDSDSDHEDTNTTTNNNNIDSHIPSILPFNIAKTSIPVAMVTPSVATVTPVRVTHMDRRLDPQIEGHAPSDSAVASALAGFVNFQKEMCKDLSKKGDGVAGPATAKLTMNTLANTIQAIKQTEPARHTTISSEPLGHTTISSVQGTNVIPVSETSQTSLSDPPPVLSPLAALLSSIQTDTTD